MLSVSGNGGEADRRKSQEAGFDEHLVKPVRGADLEAAIRSAAVAASRVENNP